MATLKQKLKTSKIKYLYEQIQKDFSQREIKYILFTNGTLLEPSLLKEKSFLKSLSLLIVSIDGRKSQHERFRKGTSLEQIEKNLRQFKAHYKIPILIWSTLRETMSFRDCFEEFFYLYEENSCDYFFWHLIEDRHPMENFEDFKESYLEDLILFDGQICDLPWGR